MDALLCDWCGKVIEKRFNNRVQWCTSPRQGLKIAVSIEPVRSEKVFEIISRQVKWVDADLCQGCGLSLAIDALRSAVGECETWQHEHKVPK